MRGANGLTTAPSSGVSFSLRGERNSGRARDRGKEEEERRNPPYVFTFPPKVGAKFLSRERCVGMRQDEQSITTTKLIYESKKFTNGYSQQCFEIAVTD